MQRVNGIPLLGYGTYPLAGEECRRCVVAALEIGYRHIDTAQLYDNEDVVGEAIARSGVRRDEIFLVTKVARENLKPRSFIPSVKDSLDTLGTDYVDLLLIHWPPDDRDFDAAIDSLCEAQDLRLTRAIGVSNFTIPLLERAVARARYPIISNQVEFHPMIDQSVLKAVADDLGLKVTAYMPIIRGKALDLASVQAIAARTGRDRAEIVLRWVIQQGVVALCNSTRRARLISNLAALDAPLSQDDMEAITAETRVNQRFCDPADWSPDWDA
jgi:diketogulonate reductase-like aldo/keto reductase